MIIHTIKRGFDIPLAGGCERRLLAAPEPLLVAVQATDFPGIKPKLLCREGDAVRTGDPLFFDKRDPDTMFASPATGTIKGVVLGERRALLRVEIVPAEADDFAEVPHAPRAELAGVERDELCALVKQAGLWPLLRQRPVGRIADAARTPSAIYVNGMDTEPLAADPAFAVQGLAEDLQLGVELLQRLTDGTVYLCVRPGEQPVELRSLQGVEVHAFAGPHPAGLAGTHIQMTRPLRVDQVAWFLKAQELALIGHWVRTGRYPTHRVVALCGTKAPVRQYYRVRQGALLMTLTGDKPLRGDVRVINGTVLSGTAADPGGFLGFYATTVTAIPDGDGRRDLFGWALPQFKKLSSSRAVASWLKPKAEYDLDARLNGGARPIVNIGAWESVMPLDIYPTFLVRAIQAGDLEEAINLGLLEVTEEDVALCTFADPCKIDVGAIVRRGLDLYEAEG